MATTRAASTDGYTEGTLATSADAGEPIAFEGECRPG